MHIRKKEKGTKTFQCVPPLVKIYVEQQRMILEIKHIIISLHFNSTPAVRRKYEINLENILHH